MYDGSFPAAVSSCGLCPFRSYSCRTVSVIFIDTNCTFGRRFLKASLSKSINVMSCDAETVNRSLELKSDEKQTDTLSSGDSNEVEEPPPDGGYGWVCVASVFIVNGFTWGVNAVRLSL